MRFPHHFLDLGGVHRVGVHHLAHRIAVRDYRGMLLSEVFADRGEREVRHLLDYVHRGVSRKSYVLVPLFAEDILGGDVVVLRADADDALYGIADRLVLPEIFGDAAAPYF